MGSSPVRVTSKSLNRTLFGLGVLLFGNPYGNGEEHIGSCETAMLATPCREFSLARNGRFPYGSPIPQAHAVVPLPIFYVFCKSTVAIYFVVAIISSLCYNNLARAEKENYF